MNKLPLKGVYYLVTNEGKLNYCANQHHVVKGSDVVIKKAMRDCCTVCNLILKLEKCVLLLQWL